MSQISSIYGWILNESQNNSNCLIIIRNYNLKLEFFSSNYNKYHFMKIRTHTYFYNLLELEYIPFGLTIQAVIPFYPLTVSPHSEENEFTQMSANNDDRQEPILYDIKEYGKWINEIDLNKVFNCLPQTCPFTHAHVVPIRTCGLWSIIVSFEGSKPTGQVQESK